MNKQVVRLRYLHDSESRKRCFRGYDTSPKVNRNPPNVAHTRLKFDKIRLIMLNLECGGLLVSSEGIEIQRLGALPLRSPENASRGKGLTDEIFEDSIQAFPR